MMYLVWHHTHTLGILRRKNMPTTMKCKKDDGTFKYVTWRFFYPKCPKINQLCNPQAGAYVAAVTVCNQRLF